MISNGFKFISREDLFWGGPHRSGIWALGSWVLWDPRIRQSSNEVFFLEMVSAIASRVWSIRISSKNSPTKILSFFVFKICPKFDPSEKLKRCMCWCAGLEKRLGKIKTLQTTLIGFKIWGNLWQSTFFLLFQRSSHPRWRSWCSLFGLYTALPLFPTFSTHFQLKSNPLSLQITITTICTSKSR